jgi:hypothetical protein
MTLKKVCRYSQGERLFRVCRLLWTRGTVGDGQGYSCKLSLGLRPVFPFVRIRFARAYGGIYT